MASFVSLIGRVLTALSPPKVDKENNAIKFGILGAAQTA
jgi:hypothetical protein